MRQRAFQQPRTARDPNLREIAGELDERYREFAAGRGLHCPPGLDLTLRLEALAGRWGIDRMVGLRGRATRARSTT
jgi:hypothetical protein